MDISLLNETIDEPPHRNEIVYSQAEEKMPDVRTMVMKFTPLDMDAGDEEYTELVAFTEVNSDVSEEEEEES